MFNNLSFLLLFGLVSMGSCYLDAWAVIELHHSLDPVNAPGVFTFRGNITIPSLMTGLSNTIQEPLTTQEVKQLNILASQREFYRLRATIVYHSGTKQTFLTSTKACGLVESGLSDVLWVSIDGAGYVTGVSETPTSSSLDCTDVVTFDSEQRDFETDVLIRHQELAPVPDTASFIQKIEREREARERGDVRDNRGFFAKYWMYIVPVVLLVFISGATNQDTPK